MTQHTIPYYKDWPYHLRAHQIRDDNGIGKLLEKFWSYGKDEYDDRLDVLPKVRRAALELAKSKDIVVKPETSKMLGKLAAQCDVMRKEIEREKKDFIANGARPVDVQFIIVDWNGKPMRNATGFVLFKSPGVPNVTRKIKLSGGGLDVNDARLRASGTVHLSVSPEGRGEPIVGATAYSFVPGRSTVIKFKAVQHTEQYRARAKSLGEVGSKLGFKGSMGADWKVVKVGAEVSGEVLERGAFEEEVEWHVKAGLPTFLDFRQL